MESNFTTDMNEWFKQYQNSWELHYFLSMNTETMDPDVEAPTGIHKKEHEEEPKETPEEIKKRARKPPADGPCKGCGKNLPLNRLMLCFKCWVLKNLLDWSKESKSDWIPGDPHPSFCGCGLPEHGGKSFGN